MSFILVLPTLVLISTLWVMLVVAGDALLFAYRKLQPPVVITCPHNASQAALMLFPGERPQVRQCSLWPAQSGCAQDCVRNRTVIALRSGASIPSATES